MEPDNDKNHFEQSMFEYIEEEKAEAVSTDVIEDWVDEQVEKEDEAITQEEVDQFLVQLEEAKKILRTKGRLVGLCQMCLDTNTLTMENDEGYTGLQYKVDNEMPILLKCTHGAAPMDDFKF